MKNIKQIPLNTSMELKTIIHNLTNLLENPNKIITQKDLELALGELSLVDFDTIPDMNLFLSTSGKFSTDEEDVTKMLRWVVLKSKIEMVKARL